MSEQDNKELTVPADDDLHLLAGIADQLGLSRCISFCFGQRLASFTMVGIGRWR